MGAKLLDIGKSHLRQAGVEGSAGVEGARARDSVIWVQKAFTVIEQLDHAECPGLAELKVSHPSFSWIVQYRLNADYSGPS